MDLERVKNARAQFVASSVSRASSEIIEESRSVAAASRREQELADWHRKRASGKRYEVKQRWDKDINGNPILEINEK